MPTPSPPNYLALAIDALLAGRAHKTNRTETEFIIKIPLAVLAPPTPAEPWPAEMEENVIEALGTKTLTGQQIAREAGYPFDRPLRLCLASMRARGLLTGAKGDVGYAAVSP